MNAKKLAEQKQSEEEILDQVMSKEDALVEVVDDLWDKYDDDYNGYLDFDEARVFMQDILKQVPGAHEFSEEAYKELFIEFDEDESGTLEKPELVNFMKKMLRF